MAANAASATQHASDAKKAPSVNSRVQSQLRSFHGSTPSGRRYSAGGFFRWAAHSATLGVPVAGNLRPRPVAGAGSGFLLVPGPPQRMGVDLGPPRSRRPNSASIRYPKASETCVNPGFVFSSCGNRLSWLSAFQLTRSRSRINCLQHGFTNSRRSPWWLHSIAFTAFTRSRTRGLELLL